MPDEDEKPSDDKSKGILTTSRSQTPSARDYFRIPPAIKSVFDKFPLVTYEANELPIRAAKRVEQHALHIFATEEGARGGRPSFNPGCLRWQTYLRFSGVEFRTIASNNHASPSGALPFLIPIKKGQEASKPVASNKLEKWTRQHGSITTEEPTDLRYDAYMSLIENRIRRAWLHSLYITTNFHSIIEPLYINTISSNPFVRLSIARDLRAAAQGELLKHSAIIDASTIYGEADEAFEALDTLLGGNTWFFAADMPGLFDASIFAYTHLLLDENLGKGWTNDMLRTVIQDKHSLILHRDNVVDRYF